MKIENKIERVKERENWRPRRELRNLEEQFLHTRTKYGTDLAFIKLVVFVFESHLRLTYSTRAT